MNSQWVKQTCTHLATANKQAPPRAELSGKLWNTNPDTESQKTNRIPSPGTRTSSPVTDPKMIRTLKKDNPGTKPQHSLDKVQAQSPQVRTTNVQAQSPQVRTTNVQAQSPQVRTTNVQAQSPQVRITHASSVWTRQSRYSAPVTSSPGTHASSV